MPEKTFDKKSADALAAAIRKNILRTIASKGSGHVGGSLSIADLLAVLYSGVMNVDPENPQKEDRDIIVLSKGHAGPALYAVLAEKGFFPKDMLDTLNQNRTTLPSHTDRLKTPGVDVTTGSLGQGASLAAGSAFADQIDGKKNTTYLILGDGELDEGQVWEASMFAGAKKLDNLCVIVDNNNLQIDGAVTDVNDPYPIDKKFEAFNFHVINVEDGNDFDQLRAAFAEARATKGMPTAIIAKTVKGKGVSYMENSVGWHGKAPNDEEYATAMEELRKAGEELG